MNNQLHEEKHRKRRQRNLLIAAIVLTILVFLSIAEYSLFENSSPLILALLNFNALLLILLIFLIFRNLIKLFIEHSQQKAGSRFRTKLVLAFIIPTLLPTIILAFVGTNLIANAIESWFDPQVGQFVDDAMDIARLSNTQFELHALRIADIAANHIYQYMHSPESCQEEADIIQSKYMLDAVQIFNSRGEEICRVSTESIPSDVFIDSTDLHNAEQITVNNTVRILSTGSYQIVQASKQIIIPGQAKQEGTIVISIRTNGPLSSKVQSLQQNYDAYQQQKQSIRPTQGLYISTFLLLSFTILFAALWIAIYLARQISEPVSHLSRATRELARGNYDYQLTIRPPDELGDLVMSFNSMIKDLRKSRNVIQQTTATVQDRNREIEAKRHELEVILSTIKAGVIAFGRQGDIQVINAAACAFWGLSSSSVLHKNYSNAFNAPNLKPIIDILERMYVDKYKVFQNEIQIETDSRLSTYSINVTPLFDGSRIFAGVVMVINDLTHLLRMQRVAAWREVARRLAHEIKNPLTPIQLNTQRMQKKFAENSNDFPSVFKTSTNSIIAEVQGLRRLLDEFSQYARMPEALLSPGNINDVILQTVALYAGKKRVNIKLEVAETLPDVLMDVSQINRVFINLIDNAIESMHETGNITIKTQYDAVTHKVRIEVIDEGQGIPDRDMNKLFLPYFSTKSRGSGLGLAICSRIITDHNGSIRVVDNIPKGARFVIELPEIVAEQS